MYQLVLSQSEYEKFKRKAKARMIEKDISMNELSEKTGYPMTTLYNFFSKQNSRFVAYAIATELGIER